MAKLNNILAGLYGELQALYADPEKNAAAIASLKAQIAAATEQVNIEKDKKERYVPEEGIYHPLEYKTEQEKKSNELSKEEAAKAGYENAVKDPITSTSWYSDKQTAFLTGNKKIPVGGEGIDGLSTFLKDNKGNLPLHFPYLMIPNKLDESRNHFVSISIRKNENNEVEVTYLDSNGELMLADDRSRVMSQFPGAKIMYRDHDGKKIPEESAKNHPEQILRVQFDDHNCGPYSILLTNMMESANSEQDIQRGIAEIKGMNMDAVRHEHSRATQSLIPLNLAMTARQSVKSSAFKTGSQEKPENNSQERLAQHNQPPTWVR